MAFNKDFAFALAFAFAAGVGAFLVSGCGEENGPTTAKVEYKDQTFSLLVCDGNGNDPNGWDHDGAGVCTLDWNGDGSGPNAIPVTYVYDEYPLIDGVAEQRKQGVPKGGDYRLWETTPWTVIKTEPIIGLGSGVKEVWAKALYTYSYPPRIWFFFRWEDPSHTIRADVSVEADGLAVRAADALAPWRRHNTGVPPSAAVRFRGRRGLPLPVATARPRVLRTLGRF